MIALNGEDTDDRFGGGRVVNNLGKTISFAALPAAAAVYGWMIHYFASSPQSFASVLLLCLLLVIGIAIVAILLSGWVTRRWRSFAATAQALAAITAIVALIVATNIYFLERRDQPRILFDITASRSLVPGAGGDPDSVLVGLGVFVRNEGNRRIEVRCLTLDLFRPAAGAPLARSEGAPEEMALEAFPERVGFHPGFDQGCLRAEEARKDYPRGSIRPLYAWAPLTLEPGEADDAHFEIPVSCEHPFMRVLVKIRLQPDAPLGYETKAIIPLREICEGNASGIARSLIVAEAPGPEADPAPDHAAPPAS